MRSLRLTKPLCGGSYVVTHDAAERLQVYRPIVPDSNHLKFEGFRQGLIQKIDQAFPGISICAIDVGELGQQIWEAVRQLDGADRYAVVSTCLDIAQALPMASHMLNLNRLFGASGRMIGYGPRPGFPPLDRQIEELIRQTRGRSLLLLEEGAFSGGTLHFISRKLLSSGFQVRAIVIGFCTPTARRRLEETCVSEIIVVREIGELIDWIPDHDLIPFTPNCGRVLGTETADGPMPILTPDGLTCAFPYILPFGRPEEWASLPAESTRDISEFCLEAAIGLFDGTGESDTRQMTIGDLVRCYPRASLPLVIGSPAELPPLDLEVAEFLHEMRNKLK